jgi:hypothetical protein
MVKSILFEDASEELVFDLVAERRLIKNRRTMVGLPRVTWHRESRTQSELNAEAIGGAK